MRNKRKEMRSNAQHAHGKNSHACHVGLDIAQGAVLVDIVAAGQADAKVNQRAEAVVSEIADAVVKRNCGLGQQGLQMCGNKRGDEVCIHVCMCVSLSVCLCGS